MALWQHFSMEENFTMIGLKHEEEEIELDLGLGLSIGGCSFRRSSEKLSPIKNEPVPVQSQRRIDSKPSDFDADLKLETMAVDLQVKREIEALRRQGAKRRREQKKATFTGIKNGSEKTSGGDSAVVHGNKMWSNTPDLETKEGESKRRRVVEEDDDETEMRNVNLNFTAEQNINFNKSLALGYSSKLCPIMYPYPAIHYVPFTNGLSWPCWASGGGGGLEEQSTVVVQSMVDQSYRGCEDLNMKSGSNGSPVCSSSVVSDYRSSSLPGGSGSSDTKSRSRANNTKDYSEHSSSSSHSRETAPQLHYHTKCATNSVDRKMIPAKPEEEEAAKEAEPVSSESQVSTTTVNPPLKEPSKREIMMGKPPKPQSHNQNPPARLPRQMMPCVSTTANGPNGKTINGFLYRYTKSEEVSIICVCHGTSFSPAEFVKHAGGKDVSNPLKHITVIPSTF